MASYKCSPHYIALGVAIGEDHSIDEFSYSDDTACDICAAYDNQFYLWAAHLLTGATECPNTDKALSRYIDLIGDKAYDRRLEQERTTLLAEIPHKQCGSCRSLVWNSADSDAVTCSNCGERIDFLADKEEDTDEVPSRFGG